LFVTEVRRCVQGTRRKVVARHARALLTVWSVGQQSHRAAFVSVCLLRRHHCLPSVDRRLQLLLPSQPHPCGPPPSPDTRERDYFRLT